MTAATAVVPPPASGGEEGAIDKQKEIYGTIAAQVARLLERARVDTENKVKMELKGIRDAVVAMDARLDTMLTQLEMIKPTAEPPLDAEHVGQLLSKIEQQWGQEIRTLKEELHQTILAHNHNADLIKHHKDTIDSLRDRCSRLQSGSSARTAAETQAQLARLEALPKLQENQPKMEPYFERLAALERKLAAAAAVRSSGWPRYPGMPHMPMMSPGIRSPLPTAGMPNPALMAQMAAAAGLFPGMGGKGGLRAHARGAATAAAAVGVGEEDDVVA